MLTHPSRLLPVILSCAIMVGTLPTRALFADEMVHQVVAGETLSGIADWYGTTQDALMAANGIADPNFIFSGQIIRIVLPGAPAREAPAAAPSPSPASQAPAPPAAAAAPAPPAPVPASPARAPAQTAHPYYHIVAPGETATSISTRYGLTVGQLSETNGLANLDYIQIGQALAVPNRVYTGRAATKVLLEYAAREYGLEPRLLYSVAWYESGWQQQARSHARATGVMQIVPETGDWVSGYLMREQVDWRNNEYANVRVGAAYLRYLLIRANGDLGYALAGYYQGWGSVSRVGRFTDTERYIANVWALMNMDHWPNFGPAPWLTPALS